MIVRSYVRACVRGLPVVVGLLIGSLARADGVVETCIENAERGQEERDAGKLLGARDRFLACAADGCPEVIRLDCTTWKADVDKQLPSIVPRVRDAKGRDLLDYDLTIDGKAVSEHGAGRAIPVDPGEHRLRWSRHGEVPVDQAIVVRVGEKNRLVDVAFRARLDQKVVGPSPKGSVGPSVWTWPLAGVAVAGFAGLAVMGTMATNRHDELSAPVSGGGCAPHCSEDQVDEVRGLMIGANVLLGVGIVATGGALWVALRSTLGRTDEPAAAASGLRITPLDGGAIGSWRMRF